MGRDWGETITKAWAKHYGRTRRRNGVSHENPRGFWRGLACQCSCFVLVCFDVCYKQSGPAGADIRGWTRLRQAARRCRLRAANGNHPRCARRWRRHARLCFGMGPKRRAGRADLLGCARTMPCRRWRAPCGRPRAIRPRDWPPVTGARAHAKRRPVGMRTSVDPSQGDRGLHNRAICKDPKPHHHAPTFIGGGKARDAMRAAAFGHCRGERCVDALAYRRRAEPRPCTRTWSACFHRISGAQSRRSCGAILAH